MRTSSLRARTRTSDFHERLRSLTTLSAHLLTFLAVFAMAPARADQPATPASRAEATAIIANARKIVTPNGVERLEKVRDRSMGLDPRHRSPESRAAIHPRRTRVRLVEIWC